MDRAEVDKVRGELAQYQQFAKITDEIIEVNEAICEARPVGAATAPAQPPDTDGEKGGSASRSRRRSPPR